MNKKKRFLKKLGEIGESWPSFKLPESIPRDLSIRISEIEGLSRDDFILFSILSDSSWFGIHLDGILICCGVKLTFLEYKNIKMTDILSLDESKEGMWKQDMCILHIKTKSNESFDLQTDSKGAVFKIDRLVGFGRDHARRYE